MRRQQAALRFSTASAVLAWLLTGAAEQATGVLPDQIVSMQIQVTPEVTGKYRIADKPIKLDTQAGLVSLWLRDVHSIRREAAGQAYRVDTSRGDTWIGNLPDARLAYLTKLQIKTIDLSTLAFVNITSLTPMSTNLPAKVGGRLVLRDGSRVFVDITGASLPIANEWGAWSLPAACVREIKLERTGTAGELRALLTFPTGREESVPVAQPGQVLTVRDAYDNELRVPWHDVAFLHGRAQITDRVKALDPSRAATTDVVRVHGVDGRDYEVSLPMLPWEIKGAFGTLRLPTAALSQIAREPESALFRVRTVYGESWLGDVLPRRIEMRTGVPPRTMDLNLADQKSLSFQAPDLLVPPGWYVWGMDDGSVFCAQFADDSLEIMPAGAKGRKVILPVNEIAFINRGAHLTVVMKTDMLHLGTAVKPTQEIVLLSSGTAIKVPWARVAFVMGDMPAVTDDVILLAQTKKKSLAGIPAKAERGGWLSRLGGLFRQPDGEGSEGVVRLTTPEPPQAEPPGVQAPGELPLPVAEAEPTLTPVPSPEPPAAPEPQPPAKEDTPPVQPEPPTATAPPEVAPPQPAVGIEAAAPREPAWEPEASEELPPVSTPKGVAPARVTAKTAFGKALIPTDKLVSVTRDSRARTAAWRTVRGEIFVAGLPTKKDEAALQQARAASVIHEPPPAAGAERSEWRAWRLTSGDRFYARLAVSILRLEGQGRSSIATRVPGASLVALSRRGSGVFEFETINGVVVGKPEARSVEVILWATDQTAVIPWKLVERVQAGGLQNLPPPAAVRADDVYLADGVVSATGGTFTLGRLRGDGKEDEVPAHAVTLSPFMLDACEVTRAQFAEFVEQTGYPTDAERMKREHTWKNPGFLQRQEDPVVCVSWYDAARFCDWRSREAGLPSCFTFKDQGRKVLTRRDLAGYRLPTEAEWEYAARGGGQDVIYPWGDDAPAGGAPVANYSQEDGEANDGWAETSPVMTFPPNALGLHDMAGNVWEWCLDWYLVNAYIANSDREVLDPCMDAPEAVGLASKVMRGGSFRNPVSTLRCAYRGHGVADASVNRVGFRCARTVIER